MAVSTFAGEEEYPDGAFREAGYRSCPDTLSAGPRLLKP